MPQDPENTRLRALVRWSEATELGLAWVDAAGQVTWYNRRWEALGGATAGDFSASFVDGRDEARACLARVRETGAPARLERAFGGHRVRLTIERDEGAGAMLTALALTDDDQQELREQLRESDERFRSAFESAGIGMALVSLDGRFLAVNRSFCEIVRFSEVELLTRDFQSVTHPDDLAADMELAAQLMRGERRSYHLEKRYVCGDGRVVWVILTGSLVREADGRPKYFIAQVKDISARKQTEAELKASEARYRVLVEAADDAIAVFDGDGRFLFANAAAAAVMGRTPAELIGRTLTELLPAERAAQRLSDIHVALRLGRTYQIERDFVAADGRRVMQTKLIPLLDAAGEWTRVLVLGRDLTEQRRLAEERQALAERAEKVLRLESLSVMAGGVAHDLNNMLAAVIGPADCARLDAPPNSDLADSLEQIADAARRAGELTAQLNAVSGKATRRLGAVDLPALVRETVTLLRPTLPPLCDMRLDLAPATIEGDGTQLRQIVLNLVLNALQALVNGRGTVTVRTGMRAVGPAERHGSLGLFDMPEGTCTFISVQDDGSGMTPEVRRRVFEPFFSTKTHGRGLGLAVVLGVARGHGGGVRVASEPGHGTLIEVLLPATPLDRAEVPPPEPTATTPRGHGVVLVVDDTRAIRDSLRRALMRIGFEVYAFESGQAALDLFRSDPAAVVLVVLDLLMPEMDGMTVLREMRRIRPDVRVVISSGHAGPRAPDDEGDFAPLRFLPKPYGLSELHAVLLDVLEGPRR